MPFEDVGAASIVIIGICPVETVMTDRAMGEVNREFKPSARGGIFMLVN